MYIYTYAYFINWWILSIEFWTMYTSIVRTL